MCPRTWAPHIETCPHNCAQFEALRQEQGVIARPRHNVIYLQHLRRHVGGLQSAGLRLLVLVFVSGSFRFKLALLQLFSLSGSGCTADTLGIGCPG